MTANFQAAATRDMGGFWSSLREETQHLRFWVFLSFGILMLFLATIVEITLIEHTAHSATAPPRPLWYESALVITSLMRELGFASLIALALVVFVEHESRARQQAAVEGMLGRVSKDVFEAALGATLPRALVRETFATVLETTVVRESQRTTLVFDEIIKDDKTSSFHYVKITVTNVFTIKNITDKPIDRFAIRLGFPVSAHPDYAKLVRIEDMYIEPAKLLPAEIQQGYDDIPDTDEMFRYRWWRSLPPQGRLEVRSTYILVKERSSNEIWRSLLPTLDLHIDITMNCDEIAFGVHALHRADVSKTSGSGHHGFHSWRLSEPVLPHQAFVVWWRPTTPSIPVTVASPSPMVVPGAEQVLPFDGQKGNVKSS